MKQNIDMYSTLWHTALDFHENYEKWYSGPVNQLKSDAIKTKAMKIIDSYNEAFIFGPNMLLLVGWRNVQERDWLELSLCRLACSKVLKNLKSTHTLKTLSKKEVSTLPIKNTPLDILDMLGDAMTTTLTTNIGDQQWRPTLATNFNDQPWWSTLTTNLDDQIYLFCFRRIADAVRTKIEKFKVHLFVLGQASFIASYNELLMREYRVKLVSCIW